MITKPNEDEIIPHYEFRTFERDLVDVAGRIRLQVKCSTIKKSSEIYLVRQQSFRAVLKYAATCSK
jgi:hypothetical protein